MEFNFHEKYGTYSNIELLKIIREPEKYQPSAVDAAGQILQSREVSEEDKDRADEQLGRPDSEKMKKKLQHDLVNGVVVDLLDEEDAVSSRPAIWIVAGFALIALFYLWIFYYHIRTFVLFSDYLIYQSAAGLFFNNIVMIYIPLIFYLVYKRRRWGWILLFTECTIATLTFISNTYFAMRGHAIIQQAIAVPVLIHSGIIFFLCTREVALFCNVNADARKKTLITMGTVAAIWLYLVFFVM